MTLILLRGYFSPLATISLRAKADWAVDQMVRSPVAGSSLQMQQWGSRNPWAIWGQFTASSTMYSASEKALSTSPLRMRNQLPMFVPGKGVMKSTWS